MSDKNEQVFNLGDEASDFNSNGNEVFHGDDDDDDENNIKSHDDQWINELRLALERGCDLGSIRNIGKCRPLTDDLRLPVWEVRNT
jgi:hypothetical protein